MSRELFKDGVIPAELIYSASGFQALHGSAAKWDLVPYHRFSSHRDGQWYVLEDNLRCPSGISHVLENRRVMKSTLPQGI